MPPVGQLTLESIVITDVRNLQRVELELSSRLNVITGNNGQGKTSILEAIYLLATSRSFRTARLTELIAHGSSTASVRGCFREQLPGDGVVTAQPATDELSLTREQSVAVQTRKRTLRINGQPPSSTSYYATRSPVVVFDSQQLKLSTGPASERRKVLDRITLFMHEPLADHRLRYTRALKSRGRLLALGGPRSSADRSTLDWEAQVAAFESLLAVHGAAITAARQTATAQLAVELEHAFSHIAAPDLHLEVQYAPAGSADVEHARAELARRRSADAHQKRASFGPHRDDLVLRIDGHEARKVASQGQHRAITLGLKTAELSCIARARKVQPILLLDDVSSELDVERTAALFEYLATTPSQILLTTTRRDLIVSPMVEAADRQDLHVEGGCVQTG